jgi:hypothetical protein
MALTRSKRHRGKSAALPHCDNRTLRRQRQRKAQHCYGNLVQYRILAYPVCGMSFVIRAIARAPVMPWRISLRPSCLEQNGVLSVLTGTRFAFSSSTVEERKIVRFRADDGEEHFGVFSSPDESKAYVAKRGPSGRLGISKDELHIDLLLPPVDPPAIFCIGLNYADHAAEVKMEIPKFPVVFMKSINTLTGHNSAYVGYNALCI